MILIFGSINVDLVARVDRIAQPGETVLSPGYELFHSGKGANQAVAANRSAPAGTSVSMCGTVGNDTFGDRCRANFAEEGIDVSLLQVADAPTGCAFISVDARGENAITVASGANHALDANQVDPNTLNDVRVAVLQMEVPLVENLRIARRLRSTEAIVILNFAPALYRILNQGVRERLGPTASARCILWSFNFSEIEELQHQGDWDGLTARMVDAARRLEASGVDVLLICTNTMHRMAPAVQAAVKVPLLHIADSTAERIKAAGFQSVGLLGTAFTMPIARLSRAWSRLVRRR